MTRINRKTRGRLRCFSHTERIARKAAKPSLADHIMACGIPPKDTLEDMTVKELREICREHDLKQAKLKKHELVEILFQTRLSMVGKQLA